MASRADLELARRLLKGSVLTEEQIRSALEIQGDLLQKGKVVSLERVLIAKKFLPADVQEVLAAEDPLATQPFPQYRLERAAGEGGSSVVYAGVYVPNRTPVAVKVLHATGALKAVDRERFYEEARLLIQCDHPNIVAGYEVGYARGHHYFSMDWIEGPTLLDLIERGGQLPNATAISITVQVASALGYLHERGLLHRDIKPGNVMIDSAGRARMIDLGLVRRMKPPPTPGSAPPVGGSAAGGTTEEEATTVGTVEYISPEQARGRGDIDVRSDIYSLGVTLYHMVVGDVPFHGETNYEVMAKQILSALDSQKVKIRRIAPEIHFFITKMMSKEREQRYASAAEVVHELSRFLPPGGPPPIVLPVSPPPSAAATPATTAAHPAPMKPLVTHGRRGGATERTSDRAPPAAPVVPPVAMPVAKPISPPAAKPVSPPVVKPVPASEAPPARPPAAAPPPPPAPAPPSADPPERERQAPLKTRRRR